MATVTDELLGAVRASGLSQAEISRRSGVDIAVLSRAASGRTRLSLPNAERLAEALGYRIALVSNARKTRRTQ